MKCKMNRIMLRKCDVFVVYQLSNMNIHPLSGFVPGRGFCCFSACISLFRLAAPTRMICRIVWVHLVAMVVGICLICLIIRVILIGIVINLTLAMRFSTYF